MASTSCYNTKYGYMEMPSSFAHPFCNEKGIEFHNTHDENL